MSGLGVAATEGRVQLATFYPGMGRINLHLVEPEGSIMADVSPGVVITADGEVMTDLAAVVAWLATHQATARAWTNPRLYDSVVKVELTSV